MSASKKRLDWIRVLDPYTWKILKALEDGSQLGFLELHEKVGGSPLTLQDRLARLERWGLLQVEMREPEVWPFKFQISLTSGGQKILGLIEEIRRLLR